MIRNISSLQFALATCKITRFFMAKRFVLRASVTLLIFLLFSACTMQTTTPRSGPAAALSTTVPTSTQTMTVGSPPTATYTVEPSEIGKATDEFPADINPLTGLRVADPGVLNRPPVAVKISNYPRSVRPQWGLSLADIVYEYYHNNDLTRFYAIFYSQDAPLAGPIRSGRLFDSYLTNMYQGILTFASADTRVLSRLNAELASWQLVPLLEGSQCPPHPVCRYEPDTSDFLLADTNAVREYSLARGGDSRRPDLSGMTFELDIPSAGQNADQIFMYYSHSAYSYWDYDPETGRYFRFQDTQEDLARGEGYAPLRDRLTGQQIAAENVVVIYVDHFHYFYSPATDLQPIIEIVDVDLHGHALAYAFRDGQAYQVEWVYEQGSGVLGLIDQNGEPFPLKPGSTWFQVVHDDSRLTQGAVLWRFEFIFRRP